MDIIEAPWTAQQVDALNSYQESGAFHPYTCGNCRNSLLVAGPEGWNCPQCNRWQQRWALASSLAICDNTQEAFAAFLKTMSPGS